MALRCPVTARDEVRAELSAAADSFRAMGTSYWLQPAETEQQVCGPAHPQLAKHRERGRLRPMSMAPRSGAAFAVVVIFAWGVLGGCGASDTDTSSGAAVTFSDLRGEEIGSQRAVIRFTTSQPATCEAEYGLSAEALSQRATDPMMAPGQLVRMHACLRSIQRD